MQHIFVTQIPMTLELYYHFYIIRIIKNAEFDCDSILTFISVGIINNE